MKAALKLGITSRRKMHRAVYKKLKMKYSCYPSHYIYTAITLDLAIFKSYKSFRGRGRTLRR